MTVHVKGKGVKALRSSAGMTLDEFGDLLGVTKGTVSRWENEFMGMTNDHFDLLQGLSEIYEVDLEKLSG